MSIILTGNNRDKKVRWECEKKRFGNSLVVLEINLKWITDPLMVHCALLSWYQKMTNMTPWWSTVLFCPTILIVPLSSLQTTVKIWNICRPHQGNRPVYTSVQIWYKIWLVHTFNVWTKGGRLREYIPYLTVPQHPKTMLCWRYLLYLSFTVTINHYTKHLCTLITFLRAPTL